MILDKELINDIYVMADCQYDGLEKPKYKQLMELLSNIPNRFRIEIKRVELVPESRDHIVNLMVNHILELYDYDEDTTEYENALWKYLYDVYQFDTENHDLLKHTFEEAVAYAIKYLKI